MEILHVNGISVFFDKKEQDSAELISHACKKSIQLIHSKWGVKTPADCRVYVMTSWLQFVFHSAPWVQKILLGIFLPLWVYRIRKMWPLVGGWERSYSRRRTVGVKPAHLIQAGDSQIGARIFIKSDISEKLQSITCHELVHAFTSHLKLPNWLKEGLAMLAVDKYFGKTTVKKESLDELKQMSEKRGLPENDKLQLGDEDAMVYQYAQGYWLTRYIDETQPGLLIELLSKRHQPKELSDKVANAYGKKKDEFWFGIDKMLVDYYLQDS
jgi:hypothetical protein